MSNIAEGFERYSAKEFIQFLVVARGSMGEVRSHLYVAFDLGYLGEKEFLEMRQDCEVVSRHIWNFMKYLRDAAKVRRPN